MTSDSLSKSNNNKLIMRQILVICALTFILFHNFINGHGFGGNTYVKIPPGHWESIEQLVEYSETQSVVSYHCENRQCRPHKILARARSTTNCYYTINLDNSPFPDITCSPLQQFYLPEKSCWAPAHALEVGNVLLTECEGNLPIVRITFFEQQLDLYALKIECPHTFFVGRHSVLTHNMNLPVAPLCWELPLTISTISTVGGLFTGFAAAASGVAVGAIAASLIYSAVMDYKAKKYHEVKISKDNMLLFAQKQHNTPKPPQGCNNNQPQDPNSKKPRCTDKIPNIHELFKRKGFGEKLKKASEPVKKIFKGAKVYRMTQDLIEHGLKKGYEFYLDTLHYNHIEVLRNGSQFKVLSLEGIELINQTANTLGRTI